MWSRSVSTWPSGSFPSYRLGVASLVSNGLTDAKHAPRNEQGNLKPLEELRRALPSEEWLRHLCHDARELVIGCAVHTCSPSCWKYHSKGAAHICRHGFYHVVIFLTEDWAEIRRRRGGKPLRDCIGIFVETQYGMAGRILTYQVHPFECPTNYAALVAMRCNVDVQDMRRVLPPRLWMPAAELEYSVTEVSNENYAHGLYPQRVASSLGAQEDWGWFTYLGTTEHHAHEVVIVKDWHEWYTKLAQETPMTEEAMDPEIKEFKAEAQRAALAAFVDSHNTGYYVC